MSEKSAALWGKFASLARRVLTRIDRLYPQDAASGARLAMLGLPEDRLAPVARLKSGVAQTPPATENLRALAPAFPRARTVLGASTHAGDEALILRAFVSAHAYHGDLRLILAPRHPRRRAEVEALVVATGLPFAVRSRTPMPPEGCVIYLADTLGEMPLWYSLAGVTIVGGSFSDRGGHTPFEPAQFGSALIHGPDVTNFSESYAALNQAQAARTVVDARGLEHAITQLAGSKEQADLAARASKALTALDDSAEVIDAIIADLKARLVQVIR